MMRIYVREPVDGFIRKTDDIAKLQYIEIDVHPLNPTPICMDNIEAGNVLFVTFHQKFTGEMSRGLYRSGSKDRRCEAHVTGGSTLNDRQVFLRAPTFDLAKRMWVRMCSTDAKDTLKPYRTM